jgi:hypothetical protein
MPSGLPVVASEVLDDQETTMINDMINKEPK